MKHPAVLSPRQLQAVKLIADGQPRKVIADAMNLSEKGVEWHVAKAKRTLGIHHSAGLIKWAYANGLSRLE